MSKKKLLLVVGSGASVEFGMPSVAGVRGIINAEAQKWYPLADASSTNLYEYIEQAAAQSLGSAPNFEQVLYLIFSLSAAKAAHANHAHQAVFINVQEFPDVLFGGRMKQNVTEHRLRQLGDMSIDHCCRNFVSSAN